MQGGRRQRQVVRLLKRVEHLLADGRRLGCARALHRPRAQLKAAEERHQKGHEGKQPDESASPHVEIALYPDLASDNGAVVGYEGTCEASARSRMRRAP